MPALACVAVDGASSSSSKRRCQGSPGFSLHKGLDAGPRASHSRRSVVRQAQRSVNFGYGALSKVWRSTSVAKLSLRRALGADHGSSGDADDSAFPGPASLETQTIAVSGSLGEDFGDIESDADSSSSTVAIEHQQTGLVSLRIKVEGIPEQEPGQSAPMLAGNRKALGAWNMDKAMKMTDNGSGAWETDILVPPGPLEFKLFSNTPMGRISPKNCKWKLDVPSDRLSKSAPGGFFIASCKWGVPDVCDVAVDTTTARKMAGRIQDAEQHMAGLRHRQEKLRSRLKKLSGKIQMTTERIGIIRGGVEEARQEAAGASSKVPAEAMDGHTRTRQELIDDLEAVYQNSSWADSEAQADAAALLAAAGLDDEEQDGDAKEEAPPQPASAVGNTAQGGPEAAEEGEEVEIVEEQEEAVLQKQQLDADPPLIAKPSSGSSPAERPSAFARESYSSTGAHSDLAESKPEAAAPTVAASTATLGADADADADADKPSEVALEERSLIESLSKAEKDSGRRFGAELPGVFLAACVLAAAQALMSVVSESKKHRAAP